MFSGHLRVELSEAGINIAVIPREIFDEPMLFADDIVARQDADGDYHCDRCADKDHWHRPQREDLWEDHLFHPLERQLRRIAAFQALDICERHEVKWASLRMISNPPPRDAMITYYNRSDVEGAER